jgi:hypothetical protein
MWIRQGRAMLKAEADFIWHRGDKAKILPVTVTDQLPAWIPGFFDIRHQIPNQGA